MLQLSILGRTTSSRFWRISGLGLVFALLASNSIGQTVPPIRGFTPIGIEPGAPAGSYALSGFDNINLYNGNLNFRLPLLQVGGRGGAGYTMMLGAEVRWLMSRMVDCSSGCFATYSATPNWWTAMRPGYSPGVLLGRLGSYDGFDPCHLDEFGNLLGTRISLARLTFTEPDGTEHELIDEATDGQPREGSCIVNFSRGTVFRSHDGSAMTFYSDTPINDNGTGGIETPSGFLMLKDGTRYNIDNGLVKKIRDRNGNVVNLVYQPGPIGSRVVSITDSLNRVISISYHTNTTSNAYDQISFTGFAEAPRSIRVKYSDLEPALVAGETLKTFDQLFPPPTDVYPVVPSQTQFSREVVSEVDLPNFTGQAAGRYLLKYNAYSELARVDLPTGGVYEYSWIPGAGTLAGGVLPGPLFSPPDGNLDSAANPPLPLQPTSYAYDVLDNLSDVTQAQTSPSVTQTRHFDYDSLKRLTDATNPESGHVHYTYDANSNLSTRLDAHTVPITTTYVYDALNRVTRRSYSGDPQNTPRVDYYYDSEQALPSGHPSFAVGASIGRLVAVCYGGATSTTGSYQGYDKIGRPNVSAQKTDTNSYVFNLYSYDLSGAMTSETYPSGRVISTAYDAAGRVNQVSGQKTGEPAKTYVSGFSYAPHGAVAALQLGNQKWEHTLFNNRLQPTEIGLGTGTSDSSILKLEYTYDTSTSIHDNNGNVRTQKITAPKIQPGSLVLTQTYNYDSLNRLQNASENGTPSWAQTYDYDRFGNRAVRSGSYIPTPNIGLTPLSAGPTDYTAFAQATNRLNNGIPAQTNILYDNAGNLTRDVPGRLMTYDAENRLLNFNNGAGQYTYDGDGRRVKKIDDTGPTIFVYNVLGQLIAEYHDDPVPSPAGGGGTNYLTSDHLGSTRVVTKQNGTVKARYDYLPFGEEIESTIGGRAAVGGYGGADATKQKFTQKERDIESGLDYFLARYYSSAQGRFTSPDEFKGGPHEVFGGVSDSKERVPLPYADITNPQSLNKYSYCYNSPLAFVDPDGHNPLFWALAALGAILAGADTANAPGRHDPIYKSEQGGNVAITIALMQHSEPRLSTRVLF